MRRAVKDEPSEGYSTERGNPAADSLQVQLTAFADETTSLGKKRKLVPNETNTSIGRGSGPFAAIAVVLRIKSAAHAEQAYNL
jgi:hypothetical protein